LRYPFRQYRYSRTCTTGR